MLQSSRKLKGKIRARLAACVLCSLILLTVPVPLTVHGQGALAQSKTDAQTLNALLIESIEKSDQNWETMSRRYSNYTFKWRRTQRKRAREGTLREESELFEVFIPTSGCWTKGCRRAVVLLEENGRPLPAERIEKERLKVGRKLEEAERKDGEHDKATAIMPVNKNWMRFQVRSREVFGKGSLIVLDGREVLEKCDLSESPSERVAGREMLVLDFRPRPNATFEAQTAYMTRIEGRIWIDAEDKVFTRLAAWPAGTKLNEALSSDQLLKRAALAYELVRTKEGIWFFSFGRINGAEFPDLFRGLKTDFSIEQFDYLSFSVEVENPNIIAPDNSTPKNERLN